MFKVGTTFIAGFDGSSEVHAVHVKV
uniref:Uncharacterized protein n=1 Tax=Tetranychus urticae TaxID=32264 RepID=T1K6I7_TETUR